MCFYFIYNEGSNPDSIILITDINNTVMQQYANDFDVH